MRAAATSVGETERGYRRGVVMGLTMAEIMLLFVFCLLLVAAGMVSDRDEKVRVAQKETAEVRVHLEELQLAMPRGGKERSAELQQENERLLAENVRFREAIWAKSGGTEAAAEIPEDTWRELTLSRNIVVAARLKGVSLVEVLHNVQSKDVANQNGDLAATTSSQDIEPGHQWPPIITLGSDRFRFERNSAELTSDFRKYLQTVTAPQVRDLLNTFQVDVVEVVGHTDESPITATRTSTLDALALKVLHGTASIEDLVPVDNAGLGLARAIAVVNALEATDLGEQGIKMIPLSAAQLIMPGDQVSDGLSPETSQDRRRIEIRVRRSMPSENAD